MGQKLNKIWCFINGHDFTEHYQKKMGDYIYYTDQTCGCCGHKEIIIDNYAYKIEVLNKKGEILSDSKLPNSS